MTDDTHTEETTYDPNRVPLEPAEIIVLEAEALKHHAEAEKLAAEARKANAEAAQAEYGANVAKHIMDREQEKRDRELAEFGHQRIYRFLSQVSDDTCEKCVKELNYWHQIDPGCDIEIMFDSPGGSVFAGMALFDFIKELKSKGHRITTSARGLAASMGGVLLQAGHYRVMGAETFFLLHEISGGAGGKIGDIEDTMELMKKLEERCVQIFADRSNLTKAKIRAMQRRKDCWLDSTECLSMGFVDEVRS